MKATVVSWVDALADSFNKVTKDVETLGLVQREEGLLGCDNVTGVDGLDQSLLEGLDLLDEDVVLWQQVEVCVAAGVGEAVDVGEVGLVVDIGSLEGEVLDGAEGAGVTGEIVVAEKLLVEVVVD